MSIQVVHITANDVFKILDLDEAHFSDLKSVDIAPGKLTKTIAAFANADGGELYIGVDEIDKEKRIRRWRGFPGVEVANGHIQAFETLFPLGQDFSYESLQSPDASAGLVLHVTVQKTRTVMQATDGKVYVRRGAQSIPYVLPVDLDRLSRNKGITSFESQTVSAPLEKVSNYETIIGFMLAVTPSAEPLPWLNKQLLVHDGKPTVAALLLFSD